ncbi:MAG: hypothetical protein M9894_19290 [Planctomycetes bacterium]|nr:hypothetical protein [Planctomycetota bacterium]
MARGKKRKGQGRRAPVEAAKRPLRGEGAGRVRGPDERTPGEDVLGEELRADDELLGEDRRRMDEVLAEAIEGDVVSDRIAAEERERMEAAGVRQQAGFTGREAPRGEGSEDLSDLAEQEPVIAGTHGPPSHGLRTAARHAHAPGLGDVDVRDEPPGDVPAGREGASAFGKGLPAAEEELGPAESPGAEALERAAAWEHTPDLERTSMELERGEGEPAARAVIRPVDQARFDEAASSAYDEPTGGERPGEAPGPGARMDRTERTAGVPAPGPATGGELEPPPASVREVQHAHDEGAAPARRPRRASRRGGGEGDEEKKKKTRKKRPGTRAP